MHDTESQTFSAIYNRYHRSVYAYVLCLVKIPEIAEDIVHEVFMKLWLIRNRLIVHSSYEGYMYRIAHNKAVDVIKKAAVDRELREKLFFHLDLASQSPDYSPGYLKKYDALLDEALASLPPQRRKVFDLCREGKMSYREVAKKLGISRNTVKEHMVKAMQMLREFLHRRGDLFLAIAFIFPFF